MGNPRRRGCSFPAPGSTTCGRWGRAVTRASPSRSGGARARAVAFGCDGRLPGAPASRARRHLPARAQRLERRRRAAARAAPRASRARPGPIDGARRAGGLPGRGAGRARCDRASRPAPRRGRRPGRPRSGVAGAPGDAADRSVLDRRGESPLAVLGRRARAPGARCSRCAPTCRAGSTGSQARTGGFALDRPTTRSSATRRSAARLPSARRARSAGLPCVRGLPRLAFGATVRAFAHLGLGRALSYALPSRCMSWSTVSALRSSLSTGP